jgi:hypothetical protein
MDSAMVVVQIRDHLASRKTGRDRKILGRECRWKD